MSAQTVQTSWILVAPISEGIAAAPQHSRGHNLLTASGGGPMSQIVDLSPVAVANSWISLIATLYFYRGCLPSECFESVDLSQTPRLGPLE
jgi:hypothetical protein